MKKLRLKSLNLCLIVGMLLSMWSGLGSGTATAATGLSVVQQSNAEELVSKILGSGITASNIKITGAPAAFGTFSGGRDIIGFEEGIILSTGQAIAVVGPNKSNGTSTNNGTLGDADLERESGVGTFDAAVLEFDFTPASDKLSFQYVFSSEEYNEYANSEFNDTFAFFVNGVNAAIVPNSNPPIPVSINTVNGGKPYGTDPKNSIYFINNELGTRTTEINTEMDGLTVVMSVSVSVNAGVKNHIKLAIADGSDETLDSNVFIKAGSLNDREARPGRMAVNTRSDYDVVVDREVGSDGTVTVQWRAVDESGEEVDAGTLTFADGEDKKTITVPIETKKVELSKPSGGATIEEGHDSQELEDIANVNAPPSIPQIDVTPSGPSTSVQVTLTANRGATIEYKLGSGEWQVYTGPVTVSENTTIVSRAISGNGLFSDESSEAISNIISRTPHSSDLSVNATTDTVTVKNVPPGATIEVFDEAGEPIGTATNHGNSPDELVIHIGGGLEDGESITIVQTEIGKPASLPIGVQAAFDPSSAPSADDIDANATKGTIILRNVPIGSKVTVYSSVYGNGSGQNILAGETKNGSEEELKIVVPGGLSPDQNVYITITEPNKGESPVTVAAAVYERTAPLTPDRINANISTGYVSVSDVPPGSTITVYDESGESLGSETRTGDGPAEISVRLEDGLAEGQIVYVTLTEPKKTESIRVPVTAAKSDEDAVNDAAKLLRIGFTDGDTWESVTAPVFLLTAGHYGTQVSWVSSKPSVIALTEPVNHEIESIINRQPRDASVVLTATVSKNDKKAVRTFLLIVKASGSEKEINPDYVWNVNVSDGTETVATLPVQRVDVTAQDGAKSKIDKVIFTQNKAEEFYGASGVNRDEARIVIDELPGDVPDEIAVEVTAGAVAAIANEQLNLNVQTDYAVLSLNAATIEAMKNNSLDLFFRLVPIRQAAALQEVKGQLPATYESMTVDMLGTPLEIDTNYSGYATELFLPFEKSGIDVSQVNVNRLRVYILHSDGEKVMRQGAIVYNDRNEPIGLSISINKFSTFSIVELKNQSVSGGFVPAPAPVKANLGAGGDSDGNAALDVDVQRRNESDGTQSDRIVIVPKQVEKVVEDIREKGIKNIKISIPDADNRVRSTEVTLEKGAAEEFANADTSLTIETSQGTVTIPAESLAGVADEATITIDKVVRSDWKPSGETVKNVVAADRTDSAPIVVGSAVQIGGSLTGKKVNVTLPLKDLPVRGDAEAVKAMASSLAIYIEKADGTSRLVQGKLIQLPDGAFGLSADAVVGDTLAVLQWPDADLEEFWESQVLHHAKYMNGYPDGTFRPDRAISRAELAAALVRGLEEDAGVRHGVPSGFDDVTAAHWGAPYIARAVELGLMTGYPDGEFKPDRKISRAEMASLAARFEKLSFTEHEGAVSSIQDVGSHWGASAIDAVVAAGVMKGYQDGTFAPTRELSRAEAVTILNRLLRRGPLFNVDAPSWSDVPATHWAYHDVEEASKDHHYRLVDGREEEVNE